MSRALLTVFAITLMAAAHAVAAPLSYTGSLDPGDANSFTLFEFTLPSAASVNIQTWGYSGGVNAAGTLIAPGGFDPYVSLFSGTGPGAVFLASNDDGSCPPGNGTVNCFDSTLDVNLAGGSYTVALTVFGNPSFAEDRSSGTLGDGFIGLASYFDPFSESWRSANYAIDISSPASAPEPGSLWLIAAGIAAVAAGRWRFVARKL